jgi:hypothetical protein
VKALGATFKPGALHPFALVGQFTFARLLTFWSKRVSLFRFLQSNDSYNDSLYVLHSFLTLAVIPDLGFSDFHIVS